MLEQQIGNTTIVVRDDEFAHAYQVGYLKYKLDYRTKTLSDMDIYALYVGVITSVRHSGRYNAGYLAGWTAALLEGGKSPPFLFPRLLQPIRKRCRDEHKTMGNDPQTTYRRRATSQSTRKSS